MNIKIVEIEDGWYQLFINDICKSKPHRDPKDCYKEYIEDIHKFLFGQTENTEVF